MAQNYSYGFKPSFDYRHLNSSEEDNKKEEQSEILYEGTAPIMSSSVEHEKIIVSKKISLIDYKKDVDLCDVKLQHCSSNYSINPEEILIGEIKVNYPQETPWAKNLNNCVK